VADINPDAENKLLRLAAKSRHDPWHWLGVAYDWGYGQLKNHPHPREWQDDIAQTITDHLQNPDTRYQPLQIAVASGHGIGKSATMGMIANWAMSCFAKARIVVTANTMSQLRTKTAPEIAKWFNLSITKDWFDVQAQTIKVSDDWRTDFVSWSANNTEAFAGLHNMGSVIVVLFDEASKIDDKVWEVTEGALTDEDTVIIWIAFGNPTQNTGRFRECFRKFRHRWKNRHIDSRDVEGTNKEQLDRMVEDYGEDSDIVKVRVRGMFPSSSMKQWIGTDLADAARETHLRKSDYDFAPVIIGVDPAWEGDDTLEVYMRQGLYSKHLLSLPKNDNDVEVAQAIARFEDEYRADAVFIDLGYGTGIKSVGDTMGREWQLIPFAGKSSRIDCLNKRMEIWYQLREWLKQGGAIDPNDDTLYEDLIGPETVPRVDGIYQLESKKDMKARGQPSPNRADALALTFALPVVSRDERFREGLSKQDFAETEYNPLDGI
jgi:hypothetical protein